MTVSILRDNLDEDPTVRADELPSVIPTAEADVMTEAATEDETDNFFCWWTEVVTEINDPVYRMYLTTTQRAVIAKRKRELNPRRFSLHDQELSQEATQKEWNNNFGLGGYEVRFSLRVREFVTRIPTKL